MLEAYASAAVLCGASLVVGQAILSLCGQRGFTCLAGPVGLAATVVASGIAIDLRGHATTVAITLGVLCLCSLAILAEQGLAPGARPTNVRSGIGRKVRGGVPGAEPANVRSGIARTVRGRDAERSPGARPAALFCAAGALPVVAGLAVLLVLTAPEWGRLVDFTDFRAFKSATISGGLGNLRHQLSPLEALGIGPASDFRLSATAASGPAAAFYLGALIAALAFLLGLPRWIRRHGPAVPAALAAAILIYLGALAFGTVYTSAKALAIASPLVVLISLGGLLAHDRAYPRAEVPGAEPAGRGGGVSGAEPANVRSGIARTVRGTDAERSPGTHPMTRLLLPRVLAALFAAGVALSSLLVLRQAPVGPQDHARRRAEEGRRVNLWRTLGVHASHRPRNPAADVRRMRTRHPCHCCHEGVDPRGRREPEEAREAVGVHRPRRQRPERHRSRR